MLGMSVKVMDVLLFANQLSASAVPGEISVPSSLILLTDTDSTRAPSQDLPLGLTVPVKLLMGTAASAEAAQCCWESKSHPRLAHFLSSPYK